MSIRVGEGSRRVTASLARVREALSAAAPALAARLARPAPPEATASLERAVGRPLPDELRALYAVTDGDGPVVAADPEGHGLLLGAAAKPERVRSMRWLPAKEAAAQLRVCRDGMGEAFAASWVPVATDDRGSYVVVDAESGALVAIDPQRPEDAPANRVAASIADLLDDLAKGLQAGLVRCDAGGLSRAAAPPPPPRDTAMAFVTLLVERGLVAFVPGRSVADAVEPVRAVLESQGRSATKAKKLAKLLDDAPWVDETFASEDVLEGLIDEMR